MSEKLERLIQQHGKNWDLLADEYEQLRSEVAAGRTDTVAGLDREASTFYDHVVGLAFDGAVPAEGDAARPKTLMQRIVALLPATTGVPHLWKKPVEVQRTTGATDTAPLFPRV